MKRSNSLDTNNIPDDVWKRVFQITAHMSDISKAYPLKQVCKRWESSFSSAIEEVTIQKEESLKQIYNLKSLRSLIIETEVIIDDDIFTNVFLKLNRLKLLHENVDFKLGFSESFNQMTNLTFLDLTDFTLSSESTKLINTINISSLVNLKYLKLCEISHIGPFESLKLLVNLQELDLSPLIYSRADLEFTFGADLDILNHLTNLKVLKICRNTEEEYICINLVQNQYKHVQFRWYIPEDDGFIRSFYEGSFSDNNKMNGKGKVSYFNGMIYEGDFKNDLKEGKGIETLRNLSRYEGEFKNDMKVGKGLYTFPDGHSYEGESTNDEIQGLGIFSWNNGRRQEGLLNNGRFEGRGKIYFPNGNLFEVEFKDEIRLLGTMYYENGNKFEGSFYDEMREGEGVMFYLNGNRYEGIFEDDERVGEGIFYDSNGEKVEGDESIFFLNEYYGIIERMDDSSSS